MWGFPRSKANPRPSTTVRHEDTVEGACELVRVWLGRLQDLLHARGIAHPPDRGAIDEQIDRLHLEVDEEIEKTAGSKRIRRMKQLALEEIRELRDEARRANP
jgi:hypothetical protein